MKLFFRGYWTGYVPLSKTYEDQPTYSLFFIQEQELKTYWGSPKEESIQAVQVPSFNVGALFSGSNQSAADTRNYHPTRFQATQLWQAFVNNVDPVIKILHIPTTQATIFAAINNPLNVDDDITALMFSIYFAGTASLSAGHAAQALGQSKNNVLSTYKQGLEQALARANILETPTIKSLQAMIIYLVSYL